MLLETLTVDFARVLATPSQERAFDRQRYPAVRLAQPSEDGVVDWGTLCDRTPPLLWLQPLALAQPGAQFTMRVTTWRKLGSSNAVKPVWVQSSGVDLLCTVGAIPGVPTPGGAGVSSDADENFCSTIVLTKGTLGGGYDTGSIDSYGPGAQEGAWVEVPALGCRLFKVEFANADPVNLIGMNALWAPR